MTKADQSILIRCEDNRINQNQPPLDLPSAVQELLVYHSVRNASNISDTRYSRESLEPNTGSSEIVHFLPQEGEGRDSMQHPEEKGILLQREEVILVNGPNAKAKRGITIEDKTRKTGRETVQKSGTG